MSDTSARGSGRTTRQLQEIGARPAIYVVHTYAMQNHVNDLLYKLRHEDGIERRIKVVVIEQASQVSRLHGVSEAIFVDHAFWQAEGRTISRRMLREVLACRERPCGDRVDLSAGFHAEPGPTPGHQHDVYATRGIPTGMERLHVGNLTKAAVEAWAAAGQKR